MPFENQNEDNNDGEAQDCGEPSALSMEFLVYIFMHEAIDMILILSCDQF